MSAWREDLAACGRRATIGQAVVAWFANPGFALACHYRLAHWALAQGRAGRVVASLIERRMIIRFASHISANARIGPGVRFPHPLSIVIGEGVAIGPGATLYHGVTLGRLRADVADYPRLGCGVTVYAGAMVLGLVELTDGGLVSAGQIMRGTPGLGEARSGQAARR